MHYLLHQSLSSWAERTPEKEAVRINGETMNYGELDRFTNQLARTLQEAGVQRGDRVGLYVHKSMASVIGVFGIMKAGAAYVPLDPNAPEKRLAYITRDCGITTVVSVPSKLASLAVFPSEGSPLRSVVTLEEETTDEPDSPHNVQWIPWATVQEQGVEAPGSAAIETDLAYILYTSGSTGNPKGVMISHRTILTFVNWSVEQFGMTPEDRVTSNAPLHFDLSTFDVYATIMAGGTIILIPETLATLPSRLSALIDREGVTITYLVPSILSLMVTYGKLDAFEFERLRLILFAGEVFPVKYLRQLVAAIPGPGYFNLYGPTETNVCTYYEVQPEDLAEDQVQAVPIGRACENMEAFAIKDDGSRVSEPGEEGELWVRGPCVAQGYWGDKEKTGQVFLQNPLNELFPESSYRTGDLVTLSEDRQNWIFLGRRDHMIKSRGYRIELGEIESVLYLHPEVKEAAVIAVPDDLVGNRLLAFVVVSDQSTLSSGELIAFCNKHLPKYMVPEQVEMCDILPKTTSGKTDRQALLART